mgnify:CR=1 FL=1
MFSSPQYYDLLDKFAEPGCAICKLLQRDAARYIDSLLYEYVNDVATQRHYRAARGLCNVHSWQMQQSKGSVLNIAILSSQALDEIETLEAGPMRGGLNLRRNKSSLADALQPTAPCPACTRLNEAEAMIVDCLGKNLDEPRLQTAFRDSAGLCLHHVRLVLRYLDKPAQAETFIAIQRDTWARLQAELQEFIRKADANFTGEGFGTEADSWQRAISALAGEPGVFGLRR